MSNISIPISDTFQQDFTAMLTIAAREAIATAKQQEASYSKEWLKQNEVCDWIGISYNTLQGFRVKGLKCSVIAGITLISKTEINRFLKENQI